MSNYMFQIKKANDIPTHNLLARKCHVTQPKFKEVRET